MKINILYILRDHLSTLRKLHSKCISLPDVMLFYVSPMIFSFAALCFSFEVRADAYNASITFFGVFIALLLNI